jgi:hypothetical protein
MILDNGAKIIDSLFNTFLKQVDVPRMNLKNEKTKEKRFLVHKKAQTIKEKLEPGTGGSWFSF